jgi:alkanesulfonate monooxygenase SsuD/methylene tetrahydromethanopterin reductase-like flavin-dependent oxidoreductase (luciferase family)
MRFDLRCPDPARARALYAAALDMAEWGDTHGCVSITLSEHHASPDGYLPSPLVMASAMAARTQSMLLRIAALVLPLHDPIRLAEDIATLDLVSGGRVSYVLALGYRPEEFALYGTPMAQRAALVEEKLPVLLAALNEGRVDIGARHGDVTPSPATRTGPSLAYGGGSIAAARRAARFGLGFVAQVANEELRIAYLDEANAQGIDPGPILLPPDVPYALFVADDVEQAWDELGEHLLYDASTYAEWNLGDATTASLSRATTVDDLRQASGSHRIVEVGEAVDLMSRHGFLSLHPLCGGIPADIAWPYLRRVHEQVVPAVAAMGRD